MAMVIGFGHRSRTGKNTCCGIAKNILEAHNVPCRVVSFAGLLKAECHRLYGWAGLEDGEFYERNPEYRDVPLPAIGKTPVEIWIEVGNKLREVYRDTWVKPVVSLIGDREVVLISDVRYPNEVNTIRHSGGCVVKVTRAEAPVRNSVSDNALEGWDQWDYIIENEGTERDLVDSVRAVLTGCGVIG